MIGQGSPTIAHALWALVPTRKLYALIRPASVVGSLCALVLCAATVDAQQTDVRLRIAWGGGAARQWQGSIAVNKGSFREVVPLGLEADEPGSMATAERLIGIDQRTPRTYDGVDLRVVAPGDAVLTVTLSPRDVIAAGRHVEIPLSSLVDDFHSSKLDAQGNRLLLLRTPGDRLRVEFDRDHLVFSPDETFELRVAPHLAGIAAEASVRCKLQLLKARSDEEFWSEEQNARSDSRGVISDIEPFTVTVPSEEGVYDLWISLVPRRFSAPFVRVKPLVQRQIQLVVVDTEAPPADTTAWKQVVEIDPTRPGWWERLKQMPKLKLIPGFGGGSLSSGRSSVQDFGPLRATTIAPQGWQAYPLPIEEVGQPHILEVEYPSNVAQTLGISIVEPNAAGMVVPLGLDSGVDVSEPLGASPPKVERHRLIFWPNTKTPLVLLTNRRNQDQAVFGKLRLLAGPAALPPSSADEVVNERLMAVFFDRPLFAENFCSDESLDPATGRTLDDWVTFHRGAGRMIEYLKHVGYNGAAISVVSQGSAIYPSRRLEPTLKNDTGAFFISGQDPVRKDVLEMLLRMFDREGMTLIAAVQFSAPLPQLEPLRRRGGAEAVGLELIDGSGKTWLQQHRPRRGMAPYYNPLDERVQQAMIDVVEEIAQRYGRHRSFGGVALQLDADTYTQLPGPDWGLDDRTMRRFAEDRGVDLPSDQSAGRFAQRVRFLQNQLRSEWLNWRAERMSRLYVAMQQAVGRHHHGAKIYLAGAKMFGDGARRPLRPSLPEKFDLARAMLESGISPELYRDHSEIVVLRPQLVSPATSLSSQAADLVLNRAPPLELHAQHPETSATLFYHQALTLPLPSFDAVSPFGKENSRSVLVAHLPPSGWRNRKRFVRNLAALDVQTMFDGGWMLPLGQEASLQRFVDVFRRLPAGPFQTVSPKSDQARSQPLIVRKLQRGERTYVYVVNDSPWALSAEIHLDAPSDCGLTELGRRRRASTRREGKTIVWQIEFQPYDLAAAVLEAPNVRIDDWRAKMPEDVVVDLQRKVNSLRIRASSLRDPQPLTGLVNTDFEAPLRDGQILGWLFGGGMTASTDLDAAQKYQGERSLRIRSSQGVAWVRSDPFPIPNTGRLSVWAWLRVEDETKQPPLRLAIEGKLNGRVYYRYAVVGADNDAVPLKSTWAPYLFHIDDLPAAGLTDLRIGFDLMGEGDVWIDDVKVFDLWFYDNERDELIKNIALADFQCQQGKLADCARFLDSYWPRFLLELVPMEPRVASQPRAGRAPLPPLGDDAPQPPKESSNWKRIRELLPKKVWPF